MESILTNEEKKILRYISKYLISVGMKQGYLETESFDEYDGFDFNTLDVREWTHFANNYSMEVPSVLYPILEKILPYAEKKFNSLDESEYHANFSRIEFMIDTKKEEISCYYWFSYYGVADGVSTTYNLEDDDYEGFNIPKGPKRYSDSDTFVSDVVKLPFKLIRSLTKGGLKSVTEEKLNKDINNIKRLL